jgi:hypothetical protein
MGLQESRGKVSRSIQDLMALWASTRVHWSDANAQAFEDKYLKPLEMDIRVAASAMDEMASLLMKIKRDCE